MNNQLSTFDRICVRKLQEQSQKIFQEYHRRFPIPDVYADKWNDEFSIHREFLGYSLYYGYIAPCEGFDFIQTQQMLCALDPDDELRSDCLSMFVGHVDDQIREARRNGNVFFIDMNYVNEYCAKNKKEMEESMKVAERMIAEL
jgi:hypothetical protein